MKKHQHILFPLFLFTILYTTSNGQTINQLKNWLSMDSDKRPSFNAQPFSTSSLNKKEAKQAAQLLMEDCKKSLRSTLQNEWNNKTFKEGEYEMKFQYKIFGEKPSDGRSLFISMHGGGNAAARVNDQQWQNQIRLYTPAEGVYVAPRAPTNTWNLWALPHIDSLFDTLIRAAIVFEDVNPNKVYLMGYSAGGDGVYQLAPRMADYWAAAAMMAGHPNDASPLGLRNIGFTIHAGALDSAYHRNEIAKQWGIMLDSLEGVDAGGYKHFAQVHAGRPHWMNREDSVAVPWMASFIRNPIPAKVVWKQDDVNHLNFYWLAVPPGSVKTGGEVIATYKGNEVNIEKNYSDTLIIHLNDDMMDLDKPVVIKYMGKQIFKGKLKRSMDVIYKTIETRKDEGLVFYCGVMIVGGKVMGDLIFKK